MNLESIIVELEQFDHSDGYSFEKLRNLVVELARETRLVEVRLDGLDRRQDESESNATANLDRVASRLSGDVQAIGYRVDGEIRTINHRIDDLKRGAPWA